MHVKPKQVEFYFFFLKLLYVEEKHKNYQSFFPITAFEKSQNEIKIKLYVVKKIILLE
jgi:hypothetical protein